MPDAEAAISSMLGLGVPVRLAWAPSRDPLADRGPLTPGELAQWESCGSEVRRRDWLLGRAALRALLPSGRDTSDLSFPHRGLSLSHAGGIAVAVAVALAAPFVGVGIDFEPWNPEADTRTTRFFLRRGEQGAAVLMRLWTIKEALYKATPDNRAWRLLDFELTNPTAACGDAVGPRGEMMRYAAMDVPAGHLAVAVCVTGATMEQHVAT